MDTSHEPHEPHESVTLTLSAIEVQEIEVEVITMTLPHSTRRDDLIARYREGRLSQSGLYRRLAALEMRDKEVVRIRPW